MSLHTLANHLQSAGRGEDKVLVHMTPGEVKGLQALAMSQGGSLSINPQTGLPEAGILSSLLPMVAGFFLGPAGIGLTAMQSALAVGALGTAATGSLGKGFMMGLGAYGGAGLGAGLTSAGGSTLSNVPGEFGVNAGTGTGADYAKWMASDAGQAAAAQTGTTTAQTVASNVAPGTGGFEALKPQGIFSQPNVSAYGAAPTAVVPPAPVEPLVNASDTLRSGLASPSDFVRPTQGVGLQDKIMSGGIEKTGTYTAPDTQSLTYDQATPTWDASKPATAPSNWDKATAGFNKATGSWEGAKEVWNATPTGTGYGLAATGMGILQSQQEDAAEKAKAEAAALAASRRGHYRPYDFSTEQDPNAYANTSTAESRYFVEPRFIAQPIEKIARNGGLMGYAVGGPVEQMSAQNAIGGNMMYPQSQLKTDMYSNPMVQRPMPTNVIRSGIDAPVDAYTGEQRFALGGSATASASAPSSEAKYSYDPATMQYTMNSAPSSGNDFERLYGKGVNPFLGTAALAVNQIFGRFPGWKKIETQQPTTNTATTTSGGIATPYTPPSGLAAVNTAMVPNIQMQPQQNVNQQLGLEAFYPMMEQQLAAKGSQLQAQGYAEGGLSGGQGGTGMTGSGRWNIGALKDPEFKSKAYKAALDQHGQVWMDKALANTDRNMVNSLLAQGKTQYEQLNAPKAVAGPAINAFAVPDPIANPQAVNMVPNIQLNQQPQENDPFYQMMQNRLSGLGGYQGYAEGGTANGGYSLGSYSDGGRLLRGPGDGVSDSIPASIGDRQPARLADGEFVVPARIVSEIGNGSTEAGARKLYAMMDRVQKARKKTVGKSKVAVNTRADKLLPA